MNMKNRWHLFDSKEKPAVTPKEGSFPDALRYLQSTLPITTANGKKAEAYFVTAEPNRRYLTGFSADAGVLLITTEQAYFLTDSRYVEAAQKTIRNCEVIVYQHMNDEVNLLLQKHGICHLMIEPDDISLEQYESLKKMLNAELVTETYLENLLLRLRSIKSERELADLKKAQKITEDAFAHILPYLKPGVSEKDIALELEFFMRKNGAERASFDLIVVSGKNSSLPHGVPGSKLLETGDFVTMDTGAVYGGMHADMTRTVALGQVSERQRLIYDTVLRAQENAIAAVKPGIPCTQVDEAARSIIRDAGFGACFGHSTGHGVGLEIHEKPSFSPSSAETTQPGMIVTVEPGIYLPDEFGVRIEDMVLVTKDGYEDLTHAPKELIIL